MLLQQLGEFNEFIEFNKDFWKKTRIVALFSVSSVPGVFGNILVISEHVHVK